MTNLKSLQRFAACALTALCLAASGVAHALVIEVSQESSAGAGDHNANVLGTLDTFSDVGQSIAAHYSYGNPNGASYNGPFALSNSVSQTFFVESSDGLHMVVVHDRAPNDGSGGNTDMSATLVGDTAAFTVEDDPGEGTSVGGGGTTFTINHIWAPCCTDGFAIGSLDGNNWAMFLQFDTAPTGITSWVATDNTAAGSGDIGLVIGAGRSARFRIVPEPTTLALMGLGLVGLGFSRRRKPN